MSLNKFVLGGYKEMILLTCYMFSFSGRVLFMKHFPYKDIKRATDGFQSIMYATSHIAAYKARFQDGGVVLIKEMRDYGQGKDAFYREVQLLGRLHHRHLLALKGLSTGHRRSDPLFSLCQFLSLNEISYVVYNHKGVKLAIGISVQHCRFVA